MKTVLLLAALVLAAAVATETTSVAAAAAAAGARDHEETQLNEDFEFLESGLTDLTFVIRKTDLIPSLSGFDAEQFRTTVSECVPLDSPSSLHIILQQNNQYDSSELVVYTNIEDEATGEDDDAKINTALAVGPNDPCWRNPPNGYALDLAEIRLGPPQPDVQPPTPGVCDTPGNCVRILVRDEGFFPAKVVIAPGQTVVWEWQITRASITEGRDCTKQDTGGGAFDSLVLTRPQTYVQVFSEPASIEYFNSLQCDTMTGEVIVARDGIETPTPPAVEDLCDDVNSDGEINYPDEFCACDVNTGHEDCTDDCDSDGAFNRYCDCNSDDDFRCARMCDTDSDGFAAEDCPAQFIDRDSNGEGFWVPAEGCVSGQTTYIDKVLLDHHTRGVQQSLADIKGKLLFQFAALDQQDVDYTTFLNSNDTATMRRNNLDLLRCTAVFATRVEQIVEVVKAAIEPEQRVLLDA